MASGHLQYFLHYAYSVKVSFVKLFLKKSFDNSNF